MKKFEDNFGIFNEQYIKVRDSRISEYRNGVYADVDSFFNKIRECVDILHQQKRDEVSQVFAQLKLDDLSDFQKYTDLRENVSKALSDMQQHYQEMAFSKIFQNRESIKKIDKAVQEISQHLKQAHWTYEQRWRQLFKIQRNDKVIENVLKQFVEANVKTLGTLAVSQESPLENVL